MRFLALNSTAPDRGATMIEYALLVSLLSVVSFAGVSMLGHDTEDKFDVIAQGLDGQVVQSTEDGSEEPAEEPAEEEAPEETPDDSGSQGNPGGGSNDDGGEPKDEPKPPAEEKDPPQEEIEGDGSETTVAATKSDFTKWEETKKGGSGTWTASVEFQNDWIADQYLTVEITKTDDKGRSRTEKMTVMVPAGSSAALEVDGNDLEVKNKKTTGVVSVDVKVVSITTSDSAGQQVSYDITGGQPTTVTAPPTP